MDINDQPANLGSPAAYLAEQLDALGYEPKWRDASQLGVELVDHPDSRVGVFHLANGDVVYPTQDGYEILEGARSGVRVTVGDTMRVHNPGRAEAARVHPAAWVDPTACVEAGATVGPRARIGPHAHVGRNAYIGQATTVDGGAFIGSGTTIRGGCLIGPGVTVGAGSDIGTCCRIGDGAQIEQGTMMEPHNAVTAGDKVTKESGRSRKDGSVAHLAHAVERLLTMERD